jgi:ABC-type oligopeptide transport system substrate-binding subunit
MALLLLGLFSSILSVQVVPASAQPSIPRAETLYTTGYDVPPTTGFDPVILNWGEGFDTYLMYEPLFGINAGTGSIIQWLGQSISWVNSTTIQVTLRPNIYWVKMLPNGTVVYDRPITSEDVEYSYYLYGGFADSPGGQYWQLNDFAERVGNMSTAFEIVSPQVFRVHILPEYANSDVVFRRLEEGFLILPWDVWTQIQGNITDLSTFANDWQDPTMALNGWTVASGMYLPYYHDDTRAIMKRNPLWWGIQVFGRGPAPEYICDTTYSSNIQKASELEAGDTDWDGDYIPGIQTLTAQYPNLRLGTYLGNPPYFADSLPKLLVPNFDEYPLNEPWLHQAIAYVLNFTAFNAVNSYYLNPASPLLIPTDDVVARELVNTTIEANYTITTNPTEALAILNQYCINVGGTWYTKVGPSADYLALYNESIDQYYSKSLHGDGVNIPLGPWNLIDVSGWTDTNAIDMVIANELSSIGITINPTFPDYTGYVNDMNSMTFDLSMYCMESGLNNDFYERYTNLFTGTVGAYSHYGDYRNPQLESLIDSLDTVPANTTQQWNIANQIEEIVGSQMPLIPVAGAPDWYIYSGQYWSGWPNATFWKMLPSSPYGGSGQVADLQSIILNLGVAGSLVSDVNHDGQVDMKDIGIVARAFGTTPGSAGWNFLADINKDGIVDMQDMSLVAADFGKTD